MRLITPLLLVALLLGCDKKLDLPPAPDLSAIPLPRAPDGKAILLELTNARLELDPFASDPITALGACADLVTYCVTADTGVDACMERAPTCATKEPWNEEPCCPKACKSGYQKERSQGADELTAFQTVVFDRPDCFPGVTAALEAP